MIILIIIAFGLIAVLQIPYMVRNRQKKELAFYILFLSFGFVLTILYALGVEIPNPVTGIKGLLDTLNIHY